MGLTFFTKFFAAKTIMNEIELLNKKIKDLMSLIEVSSIINSTLDLDELMNLVMEKAQTVMNAEASSVLLLNEQTGMLECEVALGSVQDAVKNKIQLEMGQGIAGWVAQNAEPVIVPDVATDKRFFSDVDNSTGFTTRSILAAPLIVKNKVIGVAEVLNRLDGQPFTDHNLVIFSTFCRQVALAIENARMYHYKIEQQRFKQQLESAHRIQQSFMPQMFPQTTDDNYFLYGKNIPATAVGGDLFDFIEIDSERLGIVLGDVSGKGVPAALYMARLISDLRYYCHISEQPVDLLNTINEAVLERSQRGMFITTIYMVLNIKTGELTITNAGHLPPLWYHHKTNDYEEISGISGIPLGILEEGNFSERKIQLRSGDMILIYTDGITEAKNIRGNMFNLKRLGTIFANKWDHPRDLVDEIVRRVSIYTKNAPQHDDITLMALKWQ